VELTPLLARVATVVAVVAAALLLHLALFRLASRFGLGSETAQELRRYVRWPARTVVALVAAALALPLAGFDDAVSDRVTHGFTILLIVALTWLLLRVIRVAESAAMRRFSIEMRDNLHARRKRTQAQVISRLAAVVVGLLGIAAILLTFEEARAVGASLLASAGVAGLVAGIAARTTLGNLIAGLQIAFTEPIRIDDVVVVEDEWGRIEEITLTYVVVRIWDERRLVLPTTYFVEQPFQNWTRQKAQVLGAVHLHVDYTVPVDEVRAELERVLQGSERWDGDAWVLQVVDATERSIELRALMTAEDAPTSWDLRCEVREALITWLQREHPDALPRVRITTVEAPEVQRAAARPRTGPDVGLREIGTLDAQGEPGEPAPGQGAPGQGVPGQGAPGQGASGQGVPGQGVPGEGVPATDGAGNGRR
jgi:small-conductance mechanosensitive channel